MGADKREVRHAVHALLRNLELFSNSDPTTMIGEGAAQDFNNLVRMAKRAFPEASAIRLVRPVVASEPLITLMTRTARLKGAIDSEP